MLSAEHGPMAHVAEEFQGRVPGSGTWLREKLTLELTLARPIPVVHGGSQVPLFLRLETLQCGPFELVVLTFLQTEF